MKIKRLLNDKETFVRLNNSQIRTMCKRLSSWRLVKHHHLCKSYDFPDFKKALAFINRVGKIAERLQHHPDIALSYGNVKLKTFDHKTKGLIPLDFILAESIDKVF